MKTSRTLLILIAAGALFISGAAAQHDEHHAADQNPPPADKSDTGKMSGMMSGDMQSRMQRMDRGQTSKLVDQLLKSFSEIETEQNPAALKEKLALHGALLKELQSRVQAESRPMKMMQHSADSDHQH